MKPKICIVILNWNGYEDTLQCLKSVFEIQYSPYTVIVADNGSIDGSVAAIRRIYPNVAIIENNANLGFAGGNNPAISSALLSGADYILLLNNDTVVAPDILGAFHEAASAMPDAGIFGAKIYFFDRKDTLWYAGGHWDPVGLRFADLGANEQDRGQFDTLTQTDWVIGCAMFVRAEVFKRIGLLDADFFLNFEEIDFCFRAKRAGYSCAYVPSARLWHKVSVSFGGDDSPLKTYFNERNRLLWAMRNASYTARIRLYFRATGTLLRRITRPLLGKTLSSPLTLKRWWWALVAELNNPHNRAFARGYMDFWLRRFGDCPESVRKWNLDWVSRRSVISVDVQDQDQSNP